MLKAAINATPHIILLDNKTNPGYPHQLLPTFATFFEATDSGHRHQHSSTTDAKLGISEARFSSRRRKEVRHSFAQVRSPTHRPKLGL
ncbi:hypothetical protein E2C01_035331 [Portunus trituberculatus]|uniref:Uncharacterized protein n=1 Tax=Portunus trituberculatus TaxID=210409 RepID=A0A5B7F917_PORTR|nr:hypothetical protein [Portunus trituberculatus]